MTPPDDREVRRVKTPPVGHPARAQTAAPDQVFESEHTSPTNTSHVNLEIRTKQISLNTVQAIEKLEGLAANDVKHEQRFGKIEADVSQVRVDVAGLRGGVDTIVNLQAREALERERMRAEDRAEREAAAQRRHEITKVEISSTTEVRKLSVSLRAKVITAIGVAIAAILSALGIASVFR